MIDSTGSNSKWLSAVPALAAMIIALSVCLAFVGSKGGNTLLLVCFSVLIFLIALCIGALLGLSRKAKETPVGEEC